MASAGYIFDLTPLTREVNADRRIVWQGFDVKRRHVVIGLLSFFYAAFAALMFRPILGQGAFLLFLALWALPFALIEGRSSQDLRLRNYQRLMDYGRANTGKFILCNRIVEPGVLRAGIIRASSVPVRRELKEHKIEHASLDELFA